MKCTLWGSSNYFQYKRIDEAHKLECLHSRMLCINPHFISNSITYALGFGLIRIYAYIEISLTKVKLCTTATSLSDWLQYKMWLLLETPIGPLFLKSNYWIADKVIVVILCAVWDFLALVTSSTQLCSYRSEAEHWFSIQHPSPRSHCRRWQLHFPQIKGICPLFYFRHDTSHMHLVQCSTSLYYITNH